MIIWKGTNFNSKGIVVEKTPSISKPKKIIKTINIEGRNGFLSIDTGTYDSFIVTVECHFNPVITNIDQICEFLDGYGTLSFDGIRQYTAIIQNAIKFDKIAKFKSFPIQFLVNPIAEDITPTNLYVTTNPQTLNIANATANMYPIIEITASGNVSITINNKTFNLFDMNGKYVLDCKEKVITSNSINVSDKMQYDFPFLIPGNNEISYAGTISEFKIINKKAYL